MVHIGQLREEKEVNRGGRDKERKKESESKSESGGETEARRQRGTREWNSADRPCVIAALESRIASPGSGRGRGVFGGDNSDHGRRDV